MTAFFFVMSTQSSNILHPDVIPLVGFAKQRERSFIDGRCESLFGEQRTETDGAVEHSGYFKK
jgi:hypothetical protein